MSYGRRCTMLGLLVLLALGGQWSARAQESEGPIKRVFVIAMENHNWTQPANQFTGGIQQIYQNPAAPFINSLVNGTAYASINGSLVDISSQVAYATAHHNGSIRLVPARRRPARTGPDPVTNFLFESQHRQTTCCRRGDHGINDLCAVLFSANAPRQGTIRSRIERAPLSTLLGKPPQLENQIPNYCEIDPQRKTLANTHAPHKFIDFNR